MQNDLSERSTLHVSINNQLLEENKVKEGKLTELEEVLLQEHERVDCSPLSLSLVSHRSPLFSP